ncbi:MAG: PP2C family protein-serine/threonine phosphatase [Thermoanaerobaculia bacterium]
MTTTAATTTSPKHLFRLAERTYGRLHAAHEVDLLTEAVHSTEDLFREQGGLASGTFAPLEDSPRTPQLLRLVAERVLVESAPVATVSWLLRGRQDWIARFALPGPPSEEVVLFLEIAREAVQLRLSEHAWNGVVDRVQAIQRSMLPSPIPQLHGYEVAARSVPAESVGGDVFDVQAVGKGRLVLAVADASGHGLPAALEARDVVVGIRMGLLCGVRLTELVSRLNEVVLGTTLSSRFVSLVLAEVDSDGRFAWVNAGHPPPILVGNGPPRFLEGTGRVLGVTRSYPYRLHEIRLAPGSAVVITTDGASEGLSPTDEELGSERLLRLAGSLAQDSGAAIVDGIFHGLARHVRGRGFHDDVSVLVAKRSA